MFVLFYENHTFSNWGVLMRKFWKSLSSDADKFELVLAVLLGSFIIYSLWYLSFLWLKNNFHSFVTLNTIKIYKSEKNGIIFFFEVKVSSDLKEGL